MVVKARQSGVVAICDCGTRQYIPTQSAVQTGLLYCPCGHIEKIGKDVFNKMQSRSVRAHLATKGIRHNALRPKIPESRSALFAKQLELNFVEIG